MDQKQYEHLRARIDLADSIYGEMPDGAYWAACGEMGVGSDVQLAVDDYERANKLGEHSDEQPNQKT